MKKSISETILPRRVMEIGQVKIGGQSTGTKKGGGKPPPVKYDHFKVMTRERDGEGRLIPDTEVHALIGDEPRELNIRLMYPTPEENFLSRMNHYNGQILLRVCDGEEREDRDSGECGPCLRAQGKCECKPYGRLKVILEEASTFGGLYGFRTGSWETIRNLQSALDFFFEAFGTLRGLRLKMTLYKATDEVEGKKYTNWKVGLVLREKFEDAAKMALEYHRVDQLTRRELKALASGSEESFDRHDTEDETEIGAEFFGGHEPEDESQEEEQDHASEVDIDKLRKMYHSHLTELVPVARAREDYRHAYHQAHPELPASEKEFTPAHYARVLMELQRHGMKILNQAVEHVAKKDPASEEELDQLKIAIDASGIGAQEAGDIWRVIDAGVRTWVLRDTQRLKLNAVQPEKDEGAPEPKAQTSLV